VDPDEMIIVRPESSREALWALEQSLRCPGVGATLAWIDPSDSSRLDRSHRLDSRTFRRLALGIETGGGLGLLLRSAARQHDPSWAHVRLLVEPRGTVESRESRVESRRLRIHLLRGRKGHVAESLELELRDEPPDPVRLAAPLAGPAASGRATGT
jgi:protein ImuA